MASQNECGDERNEQSCEPSVSSFNEGEFSVREAKPSLFDKMCAPGQGLNSFQTTFATRLQARSSIDAFDLRDQLEASNQTVVH